MLPCAGAVVPPSLGSHDGELRAIWTSVLAVVSGVCCRIASLYRVVDVFCLAVIVVKFTSACLSARGVCGVPVELDARMALSQEGLE